MVAPQELDIAILMPKITDYDRTNERYGGLMAELAALGLTACMVETHASYQGDGVFRDARVAIQPQLGYTERYDGIGFVKPTLVRDLTMPKESQPLYADAARPRLVHDPDFNKILASKSMVYDLLAELQPFTIPRVAHQDVAEAVAAVRGDRVVVKPDTGSAGQGVIIGEKKSVLEEYEQSEKSGLYVVQEAIDMSRGLAEHGVEGVHNVRFVVIGGVAIFGFIRSDASGSLTMQNETFENRTFSPADAFKSSLHEIVLAGTDKIVTLPDGHNTVFAVDLIRGVNAEGDMREYVLEVNRRPLRNSPYDGHDANTLWASAQWDTHEAAMLKAVAVK